MLTEIRQVEVFLGLNVSSPSRTLRIFMRLKFKRPKIRQFQTLCFLLPRFHLSIKKTWCGHGFVAGYSGIKYSVAEYSLFLVGRAF